MSRLDDLVATVAHLRGPKGCPWDRAQDLSTMRPYLLEEVYEVLHAMDQRQTATGTATQQQASLILAEELGDLLFVLLMLVRISQDRGDFDLDLVADGICTKMVVRHPHVFRSVGATSEAGPTDSDRGTDSDGGDSPDPASVAAWESRKARHKTPDGRPRSRLAGVPDTLPGLLRAHRQGEKAATVGFDWPDYTGVVDKIHEELAELEEALAEHPPQPGDRVDATGLPAAHQRVEHELGDLLMAVASLGRHVGAPPEDALRRANDRFRDRFQAVERMAQDAGQHLDQLDEAALDALWERAKAQLGSSPAEPPAR